MILNNSLPFSLYLPWTLPCYAFNCFVELQFFSGLCRSIAFLSTLNSSSDMVSPSYLVMSSCSYCLALFRFKFVLHFSHPFALGRGNSSATAQHTHTKPKHLSVRLLIACEPRFLYSQMMFSASLVNTVCCGC